MRQHKGIGFSAVHSQLLTWVNWLLARAFRAQADEML
jgi:hypothetical protein